MTDKQTCIVMGGGLAGLVAARNLARAGWEVRLFEKQSYVGGKAAALKRGEPVPIEHGYHVFPRWYENIRGLLEEINQEVADLPMAEKPTTCPDELQLLDLDGFYYLRPGGEYVKMYGPKDAEAIFHNIFDNFMPWYFQGLYVFSVIDMLRTSLNRSSMLDRISQIGFIRDRFYATEAIARINQENMLKGSAIPAYEMSTMTAKKVAGYWIAQSNPFVSILPGNLQTWFITPLEESAKRAGVTIHPDTEVIKLEVGVAEIDGVSKPVIDGVRVKQTNGAGAEDELRADTYVLATPLEATRKLIDDDVYKADPELGNIEHIETEPMSALHLFTDQTADDLGLKTEKGNQRSWHIFLTGSHYGLSFIDNSQWDEMTGKGTYLSFIASNFSPLREVADKVAIQLLIEEIEEYIPRLDPSQITKSILNRNTDAPLYINTVGSWANRPRTNSAIDNLFVAGDYVKNEIDLACMEGAVFSGIEAAHQISKRYAGSTVSFVSGAERPVANIKGRVASTAKNLLKGLPKPTALQPTGNRLTRWSRMLARRGQAGQSRGTVSPPPKVPVTWPRGFYWAVYAAGLTFPGTWIALLRARIDEYLAETKFEYSRAKQAANTRLRDDRYGEARATPPRTRTTPPISEIRELARKRRSG